MSTKPLSPDDRPVPDNDGIDHINVMSKAKTALGRELSNFAHKPFHHPKYGFFASVEAFWYWLSTGLQHNALRRLYGATAKTAGIRLLPVAMDTSLFQQHICDALRLKVVQNPKLRDALSKSTLPFRHYFIFGSHPVVVREAKKHNWQMDCLEEIRASLQAGVPILLSDGTKANTVAIKEEPENPVPDDMQRYIED